MLGSMTDIAARMQQRSQRLREDQQRLERKKNAPSSDVISEPSELESSRQAPKPKHRNRASLKSPFDDDSSIQFGHTDKKSTSTTSSSTPRQPNKFVKKATNPKSTEKISAEHSPRPSSKEQRRTKPVVPSSTGLLASSSLLARAVHRQQLHAQGIELVPGTFDQANKSDDESSSDATTTSGSRILFGGGKKTFLKKPATTGETGINQVPDLLHLDSETYNSDRGATKSKRKKNSARPSSAIDTEDDSSLDFIGEGSSSEGRKTPTLTPKKGILKSPKDFVPKESEHSVQFSVKLVTVNSDEERTPTPPRTPRPMSAATTQRRVHMITKSHDEDEVIPSETESISTAIDIADDDDIQSSRNAIESPVDNMFANLVMNDEPLVAPVVSKKTPRRSSPRSAKKAATSSLIFHPTRQPVSEVSEDEYTKVEEIPEELSVANYSEDFSSVPTESSTPRSPKSTNVRIETPPRMKESVSTYDQQVQVDFTSAPFQSSLSQVPAIYLINQSDLNDSRPSSLIRSVVQPKVLESLLTTNPVLLAVDDLIREQSFLLRSFVQLQRTFYESTVRSIRPDYIYVTKDNTLQLIADQQRSRIQFQSHDDSIST